MASEIIVQTIKAPTSGANANKVIIPSGVTLDASAGTLKPPAGHIVQAVSHSWSSETNTTSSSYVDVQGGSMSFTPRYSDSTIVVQVLMHIRWDGAANNGGSCRIVWNGNAIFSNANYANYDNHNVNTYQGYAIGGMFTSGTTSAATLKVQSNRHGSGNYWINWGGNFQSNMTVTEIAQ